MEEVGVDRAATMARRDRSVLVVVDIQERLAAAMADADRVIGRTALLVRSAAIVGLPIVVTRQYPKGLGGLRAEVETLLVEAENSGAEVVRADKVTFDCFAEPSFSSAIEAMGRSQIVLAGMESHICIAQTTLTALSRGFDVHLAADACCSLDVANHQLALVRLGLAGAQISTAESVAYELVREAGTPEFKRLLSAVKGEPLSD
jgi:nicotinamidase-related amidase